MYRILIVEDESIIRSGLRRQIPWDSIGFTIVGEAVDGREALLHYAELQPDVVLSDIRMPDLDGLTLFRQLRDLNSDLVLVILTGYSDFEYARRGIDCGIAAYLLKPVSNEDLIAVFARIREDLDQRQNQMHVAQAVAEQAQYAIPIAAAKLLWDALLGRTDDHSKERLVDYYHLPAGGCGTFVTAVLQARRGLPGNPIDRIAPDRADHGWPRAVALPDPEMRLLQTLQDEQQALIAIWLQTASDTRLTLLAVEQLRQHWSAELNALYGRPIVVSAGVGQPAASLSQLPESLAGARLALSYKFIRGCGLTFSLTDHQDAVVCAAVSAEHEEELVSSLIRTIVRGQPGSLPAALQAYLFYLRQVAASGNELVFIKTLEMLFELNMRLNEAGVDLNRFHDRPLDSQLRMIIDTGTFSELEIWLEDLLIRVAGCMRIRPSERTPEAMVEQAKAFIRLNYMRHISRDELCSVTYTSPSYFFSLFKRLTGCSFLDYLARIRIEKAKELLRESDLKVYEIASSVGYDDFRHFSRVFKKLENVLPTAYKRDSQKLPAQSSGRPDRPPG